VSALPHHTRDSALLRRTRSRSPIRQGRRRLAHVLRNNLHACFRNTACSLEALDNTWIRSGDMNLRISGVRGPLRLVVRSMQLTPQVGMHSSFLRLYSYLVSTLSGGLCLRGPAPVHNLGSVLLPLLKNHHGLVLWNIDGVDVTAGLDAEA